LGTRHPDTAINEYSPAIRLIISSFGDPSVSDAISRLQQEKARIQKDLDQRKITTRSSVEWINYEERKTTLQRTMRRSNS